MTAAFTRASSLVTEPSLRPRVAAKPELVVARASKPSDTSNLAEPRSQGFGIRSGSPGRCRARNRCAWSAGLIIHITYRQSLQTLDASTVQKRKMPGQWRWRSYEGNSLDWVGRWLCGMTVVMVTAGHLACGPVTAMRSLSSALGNRHDQEGAARHRPVGGGRRNG